MNAVLLSVTECVCVFGSLFDAVVKSFIDVIRYFFFHCLQREKLRFFDCRCIGLFFRFVCFLFFFEGGRRFSECSMFFCLAFSNATAAVCVLCVLSDMVRCILFAIAVVACIAVVSFAAPKLLCICTTIQTHIPTHSPIAC